VEHQQHRRRHRHRNKPDVRHERHTSPALENLEREIDSIDRPNLHAEKHVHPQRKQHGSKPFMSIVIPLLNEEESLKPLYDALEEVIPSMSGGQYEVIFIDDGSTDSSFSVIRKIHEVNPRYKAIRFRRNCGKSAALAVGFAAAKRSFCIYHGCRSAR